MKTSAKREGRKPAGPAMPESSLRKAQALLRTLSVVDLEAAIPGAAKVRRATPCPAEPSITLDRFAEVLNSIVTMIDTCSDVKNCDVSGPGCYIDNNGDERDRAEAFLALLPIVERIIERKDVEREDKRAPTRLQVN